MDEQEEGEGANDSGDNSDSDYDFVSDCDEESLSFNEHRDGVSDDPHEAGGVANGAVPKEQADGGKKGRSNSRMLHATNLLVTTFHLKLEHVIMNIADYPPALTFVK